MSTSRYQYSYINQPQGYDETGEVIRFKENKLFNYIRNELAHSAGVTLNDMLSVTSDPGYYSQVYQLIGYSHQGYFDVTADDDDDNDDDRDNDIIQDYGVIFSKDFSPSLLVFNMSHPTPLLEETKSGELYFEENVIVHRFIDEFGYSELLRRINYQRFSYNDFSQLMQLYGLSLGDYQHVMENAMRLGRCEHYIQTLRANGIRF